MKLLKRVVALLSVMCIGTAAVSFAGCGKEMNDSSQQNSSATSEGSKIEQIYAQYVIHAKAEGVTPLSYEEWLASIKGEKGDKGDTGAQGAQGNKGEKGDTGAQGIGIESVAYDANGNLIITFTDGTSQTVEMPDKHVHTYGEWKGIGYFEDNEYLYYRTCTTCKNVEWKAEQRKQSSSSSDDNSSSGESGNIKGMIDQSIEFLDLGSDFDTDFYPDKKNIKQQSGKIDVVIMFEGMEDAWRAVADEYERLHSGAVVVKLDNTLTAANYQETLIYELTSGKTDWDIVQGNLAGGNLDTTAMNLAPSVEGKNAYAGAGMYWRDVLMEDAYITDKTGENTATYIMNSEGLQTAWFVNEVALKAAAAKGYNNGVAKNPETWDELMSLCYYMEMAGYDNPLGIALDNSSISASQFSWLLRVYGDYYYRNEYTKIMADPDYGADGAFLTMGNPEGGMGYNALWSSLFNLTLDETSPNYVGGTSPKFADFISQFGKMKDYLSPDAATTTMEQMRNAFMTQSNKKDSPQIMLDYAGWGLTYGKKNDSTFKLDFFDYPIMESEYVTEGTLLRDVGGNGGYLSVVMSKPDQNNLNLDFLKFFMTPYGQTIYYNALKDSNVSPKGLTTVENDYVLIPEEWKEFFKTDKISFTGLADNNPFVGNFIRSLSNQARTTELCPTLWQKYLTGKGNNTVTVEHFGCEWQDTMMVDWKDHCWEYGWNENCYKYPGKDVWYGG